MKPFFALIALLLCVESAHAAEQGSAGLVPPASYAAWKMGPPAQNDFFPIAVWLQNPQKAKRYCDAGFNVYVALWNGPTDEQLATLKAAGMRVICEFNEVGRKHIDDPTIIGWMHGDEPDNAQSLGAGKGYGPPIEPKRIIADYEKLRAADPSRPVMLNLGQGVAWDQWYGRGVRSNHPEDYKEYIKGGDIISFDIYPVAHDNPQVSGKLEYVARGVERLMQWSEGKKIIWNCIECTRIQTPNKKATPEQVRTEVWMSLIHGSKGLIYFVHEWTPKFSDSALLEDPVMLKSVSDLNHQIQRLAPILNAPTASGFGRVTDNSTIATMVRQYANETYLFAVNMSTNVINAEFSVDSTKAEVVDEGRSITVGEQHLKDRFQGGQVHIYRFARKSGQ